MIQAGDLIDSTIGVRLGIATLTAAAMGQVFSDTAGVVFGGTVEAAAARLGFPAPNLSKAQRALPRVKFWGTLGAVVGVVSGCLIAMTQLLWMDLEKAERLKEFAEVEETFSTLMKADGGEMGAELATLYFVDGEKKKLWSVAGTGPEPVYIEFDWDQGIAGKCATTGKTLNLADAYDVPYFNQSVDQETGHVTKSVLCVPIFETTGGVGHKCVAVAQFINKKGGGAFNKRDVEIAETACRYIALFKPIIAS